MFDSFLMLIPAFRRKRYRDEYRKMTENERDAQMRLMEHYSVFGSSHNSTKLIEMCQAAQKVEKEKSVQRRE